MGILTIHSPNSWTWNTFSLICVFFTFFPQCLIVFVYRHFTSFIKFIPRYFILFDSIVNEIVFLISLSDSLLVYISANDFCILVLYPASLLNLLIISKSFLVKPLGFSTYIMSSANRENFTFSFSIGMPLFLFLV